MLAPIRFFVRPGRRPFPALKGKTANGRDKSVAAFGG
jgi:hypothetical protein